MKNHILVGGRLLQTNKKWTHLKQKQKEWIANLLKTEYINFVQESNRKPNKGERDAILNKVYSEIEGREIWIPYYEVKQFFVGRIYRFDKYLRKST
jgi:hypothetical protein